MQSSVAGDHEESELPGSALWALEATTDCVLLLDRDLRVRYVNANVCRLNHRPAEAFVGRLHAEAWPETLSTPVEDRYREAMASGETITFEQAYENGKGGQVWHEVHARPISAGVAVFYRDVTALKQVSTAQFEDRERLASAVRATDLGVWYCELPLAEGSMVWSPQLRRQFGIFDDRPVNLDTWLAMMHPEDLGRVREAIQVAIDTGAPFDATHRILGADGVVRHIRAVGNAFYKTDGTPYRFDGFTVDLSAEVEREREFAEARIRMDAVLAHAQVGTYVIEPETGRVNGDARLAAMFGFTKEQARDATIDELLSMVHKEERATVEEVFHRVLAAGAPYMMEFRIVVFGQVRWISARGLPEKDDAGRVLKFPGVVIDVTDRRTAQAREYEAVEALRLSERRQRLRVDVMDAIRDLADPQSIIETAGLVVCRFFGATRAMCSFVDNPHESVQILWAWQEGAPPIGESVTFEEFGRPLIEQLAQGKTLAISDTSAHDLTRERFLQVYAPLELRSCIVAPRIREGAMIGIFSVHDRSAREWTEEEVGVLEDVANRVWDAVERAQAIADLHALNADLDERVHHRTAELRRANEEAESFNYSIAHDLRAPLRAIVSTSHLLLDDLDDRLDDTERDMLQRQSSNALRLGSLIDALLNLSRLSRVALNKTEIDLSGKARSAFEDLQLREGQKSVRIEIQPEMRTFGDPRLIRVVMQNLIENAIKFSPAGGTVWVGEPRPGTFCVRDEGIGFDMEYAAKLFMPFERLVSEEQYPGTGIGLANVKRIVERHGGKVWAEGVPGQGAAFYFTLTA